MGYVEQRISLVTLGVADSARYARFDELLGWRGESPDGDVVFFQTGGMIVGLWSREKLAEDSCVRDGGGWGGIALAHNVRSPEEVDAVLAQAEPLARPSVALGRPQSRVRRVLRGLLRPRRPPLGDRPQPWLPNRCRRVDAPPLGELCPSFRRCARSFRR